MHRANEKTRDESTDERAENEASSRRQRRPLRSDEGSNFRTKDGSKTDVEREMKEKIKSKQIGAHSWLGTRKIHSSTGVQQAATHRLSVPGLCAVTLAAHLCPQ